MIFPPIVGFPGGAVVKDLPANAGDVGSTPGQKDPLEKGMAARPSILVWRSPWTEDPGRLQSMELQRVRHDGATSLSLLYKPSYKLCTHSVSFYHLCVTASSPARPPVPQRLAQLPSKHRASANVSGAPPRLPLSFPRCSSLMGECLPPTRLSKSYAFGRWPREERLSPESVCAQELSLPASLSPYNTLSSCQRTCFHVRVISYVSCVIL